MAHRLTTVITTSRLKLRDPSAGKETQFKTAQRSYSNCLLMLMKVARQRFDPEQFIKLTVRRGKSYLNAQSLHKISTWVNSELKIKELQLNAHLKLGLIYHISSALRGYVALFIEDVDSPFPFSNYIQDERTISLDETLSRALTCVTLEQEREICANLLKKRNAAPAWQVHLTAKSHFALFRSQKMNRHYLALPINMLPEKRGRRSQESAPDLINILEDLPPVAKGPWVYFALDMGRRDWDLLMKVEECRPTKWQSGDKKDKQFDIGACALEMVDGEMYVRVFIKRVLPISEGNSLMAVHITPYNLTCVVKDLQDKLLDCFQWSRYEGIRKVLSMDKAIAQEQRMGQYRVGRKRRHLTTLSAHLLTNHLVARAREYDARIILQGQAKKKKANPAMTSDGTQRMKRKKRIAAIFDHGRICQYLEYKSALAGLVKPFVLKIRPLRYCCTCQSVLAAEDIDWKDRLCICRNCGHSESLDTNSAANMISCFRRVILDKGPSTDNLE